MVQQKQLGNHGAYLIFIATRILAIYKNISSFSISIKRISKTYQQGS